MFASTDTFNGLVNALQETLRHASSDLHRLAQQHRLELKRLAEGEAVAGTAAPRPGRRRAPGQAVEWQDLEDPAPSERPPKRSLRRWAVGEEEPLAYVPTVAPAPSRWPRKSEHAGVLSEVALVLPRRPKPPLSWTENAMQSSVVPTEPALFSLADHNDCCFSGPCLEAPDGHRASAPSHRALAANCSPRLGCLCPEAPYIVPDPQEHRRAMRRRVERLATPVSAVLSRETRSCLPDAAAMKEQVLKTITKPEYSVASFYHSSGIWQAIAKSQAFEVLTLSVIFFNTIWVAIEIDADNPDVLLDAPTSFQVVEHFICAFFLSEWAIRFLAFRKKKDSLKDRWFVFDTVLVVFVVLDTWVMTLAEALIRVSKRQESTSATMGNASMLKVVRLARLLRLARVSKLLLAFPEIVVIIRGIGAAVRAVFFTMCLQFFVIYVFAVAFRQITADTVVQSTHFQSVPQAFTTLLLRGILPDYLPLVNSLGRTHVMLGVFGLGFVFLATITIMNFIVGVLVEVVKVVSAVEREQVQIAHVRKHLIQLLPKAGLDKDHTSSLSRRDFEEVLLQPRTATFMRDVGVDVVGLVDFIDIVFKNGRELPISEFIQLVLQLRGTNSSTVRDFFDLRKFMILELRDLEESLTRRIIDLQEKLTVEQSLKTP